jgi:hypothetical protein
MELLMLDDFAGCVNETFDVAFNGMNVPFVLVEARPLQVPVPSAVRAPFSLLFRNASAFLFPQGTYSMRHGRIGDVGIFIVPVAQEKGGFLYQAVFN